LPTALIDELLKVLLVGSRYPSHSGRRSPALSEHQAVEILAGPQPLLRTVEQIAYTLPCDEAIAKLSGLAKELEVLPPGAAASLRVGLEESLTVNRWSLSKGLTSSLPARTLSKLPSAEPDPN
jgi:hypothetical protein